MKTRYFVQAALVAILSLPVGCAAPKQWARGEGVTSGSRACDLAIAEYNNRAVHDVSNFDREPMLNICNARQTGSLTSFGRETELSDLRTWSGPNGLCEFTPPKPKPRQSPTLYYVQTILPIQTFRLFHLLSNSNKEIDLDCIDQAFRSNSNASWASEWPADPVASYYNGMMRLRLGCENLAEAEEALRLAGAAEKASHIDDDGLENDGALLIPEALLMAAMAIRTCDHSRVADARDLAQRSYRGGYTFAGPLDIQ